MRRPGFDQARVEGLPAVCRGGAGPTLPASRANVRGCSPPRLRPRVGSGLTGGGRAQGEAARAGTPAELPGRGAQQTFDAPFSRQEANDIAPFAAAVLPCAGATRASPQLVQEEVTAAQTVEALPPACADMRFWAASSFKEVSPATRTFVAAEDRAGQPAPGAAAARALRADRRRAGRPRHDPRLREQAATIERATTSCTGRRSPVRWASTHPNSPIPAAAQAGRSSSPAAGRRPANGGWRGCGDDTGCGLEVTLGVATDDSESSTGWCRTTLQGAQTRASTATKDVSRSPPRRCREPRSSACASATATRSPPPRSAFRSGSAGRSASTTRSSAGPSPIPRLLTELGASGRVLRITHLPRIVECTKHPIKYLDGGAKTLATGTVPDGGPAFSILGERYRFLGKVYFRPESPRRRRTRGGLGGLLEGSSRIAFGNSKLRNVFRPMKRRIACPSPTRSSTGGCTTRPRRSSPKARGPRRRSRRCPCPLRCTSAASSSTAPSLRRRSSSRCATVRAGRSSQNRSKRRNSSNAAKAKRNPADRLP